MQPEAVGAGVDGDAVPVRGAVEERVAGVGEDRRRPARHGWRAEARQKGMAKRAERRRTQRKSR